MGDAADEVCRKLADGGCLQRVEWGGVVGLKLDVAALDVAAENAAVSSMDYMTRE